ncbi:hypothetical protein BLNAU_2748 [Blattamonas nauphoetae]|uniref:Uncharacterized protein n=1 Tax=Blattamonas nauphoetae TaxID=2049346 RepID=A0ABQ9YE87_9EUKA|nr:hypothetical protein BLNAU_2748 [Blattamonas nauphoetae]
MCKQPTHATQQGDHDDLFDEDFGFDFPDDSPHVAPQLSKNVAQGSPQKMPLDQLETHSSPVYPPPSNMSVPATTKKPADNGLSSSRLAGRKKAGKKAAKQKVIFSPSVQNLSENSPFEESHTDVFPSVLPSDPIFSPCLNCEDKSRTIQSLQTQLNELRQNYVNVIQEKDALSTLLNQTNLDHQKEIANLQQEIVKLNEKRKSSPISSALVQQVQKMDALDESDETIRNAMTKLDQAFEKHSERERNKENEMKRQKDQIKNALKSIEEREASLKEHERILGQREEELRASEGKVMELVREMDRKAQTANTQRSDNTFDHIRADVDRNKITAAEKILKEKENKFLAALVSFENEKRAFKVQTEEFTALSEAVIAKERAVERRQAELDLEWKRLMEGEDKIKSEAERIELERTRVEEGMRELLGKERRLDEKTAEIVQMKKEATEQSILLSQSMVATSFARLHGKSESRRRTETSMLPSLSDVESESGSESESATTSEKQTHSADELILTPHNRHLSDDEREQDQQAHRQRSHSLIESPQKPRQTTSPERKENTRTRLMEKRQSRTSTASRPVIHSRASGNNSSLMGTYIQQIAEKRRDLLSQSQNMTQSLLQAQTSLLSQISPIGSSSSTTPIWMAGVSGRGLGQYQQRGSTPSVVRQNLQQSQITSHFDTDPLISQSISQTHPFSQPPPFVPPLRPSSPHTHTFHGTDDVLNPLQPHPTVRLNPSPTLASRTDAFGTTILFPSIHHSINTIFKHIQGQKSTHRTSIPLDMQQI